MSKKKTKYHNRPAIHTDSGQKDTEAISIISAILAHNRGVAPELNHHDTWPNTDGHLELTTDIGVPDGKLEVQVKSIHVNKQGNVSHTFDTDKFLEYCKDIGDLPVLFIGVDLENQQAYWVEMTPKLVTETPALTIKIPKENLIARDNLSYYKPWKSICDERKQILRQAQVDAGKGYESVEIKEMDPSKSAIAQLFETESNSKLLDKNISAVNSIIENIREKILLYEGCLFLVSPTYINDSEVRQKVRDIVNITHKQEDLFIEELISKKILSNTGDIVVFENDALGHEKVAYLIKNNLLNIDDIYKLFPGVKVRKSILKKIANISNVPAIDELLTALADDLVTSVQQLGNDDVAANLDLLNEYSFRVPKETVKIAKKIIACEPKPPKIHKTELGQFKGVQHRTLLLKILDVLQAIRYLETKSVFNITTKLVANTSDDTVKKKALGLVKEISEYNLYALRKIGYYSQNQLLDVIELWKKTSLERYKYSLFELGRELLNTEFEGSEMTDYKTLTMSFGPLKATEELRTIRKRVSTVLIKFFNLSNENRVKKQILNILEVGSRTPIRGKYSDELEQLLVDYVNGILMPFYFELPKTDLILTHQIERQLHWFIKRYGDKKIKQSSKLRKKINENELYKVFKIFYGYDYDFDIGTPWREARDKRENLIDDLINSIDDHNIQEWRQKLLLIADAYDDEDPSKLMYFNKFLENFAKRKPALAFKIINEAKLEPFLTYLIAGLWQSDMRNKVLQILLNWIDKQINLEPIANLFWFIREADLEIMQKLLVKAKKLNDSTALTALARGVASSYKGEIKVRELFFETIEELTRSKSVRWIYNFYLQDKSLLSNLTTKEVDILLANLLLVNSVDHNVEEILTPTTKQHPGKIINFFYNRIKLQAKKDKDERYDALPYNFYELHKTLAESPQIILDEVFKWFRGKDWLYHFDTPRFLQLIFPDMNEPLKLKLFSMIKEGGEENAGTVLSVLRAYKGESHLHNIIKAFIKKYLRSDKNKRYEEYKGELFIALSTTGVVSGEYGLPNAYKQKKESINSWKKDKSKTIQRFIKEYEAYLDKEIAYHTKRADEDIELMKRGAR